MGVFDQEPEQTANLKSGRLRVSVAVDAQSCPAEPDLAYKSDQP
jgi:hypothetical protein